MRKSGSPFRYLRGISMLVAFLGVCADRALAAPDNVIAVTPPFIYAEELDRLEGLFSDLYAEGLERGAPCYSAVTTEDVMAVAFQAQVQQALGDDLSMTDALMRIGGRYGDARYLAVIVVGKVGSTFVVNGRVLNQKSVRIVAAGQRRSVSVEGLAEAAKDLGRELGAKLPCSLVIDGQRQINAATIENVKQGALAGPMAVFGALAPMVLGEWQFSGRITQSDTVTAKLVVNDDGTTVTSQADWTAVVDAPNIGMTSRQWDVATRRAPFTLHFRDHALAGTYDPDTRNAHFELEFLDQGQAAGGVGEATVTQERLAMMMRAFDDIADWAGIGDEVKKVEEQAEREEGLPPGFDLRKPVNTFPIPMPDQTDAAYFLLQFDINLRDDDEKSVTGSDFLGPFNYTVRIVREEETSP